MVDWSEVDTVLSGGEKPGADVADGNGVVVEPVLLVADGGVRHEGEGTGLRDRVPFTLGGVVHGAGFPTLKGRGGQSVDNPTTTSPKQRPQARPEDHRLPWNKRLRGASATRGGWSMGDERGRATGGAEGTGCGALAFGTRSNAGA